MVGLLSRVALEGTNCPQCEQLLVLTLCSRLALFDDGGRLSRPRSSGPAAAEAQRRLRLWASQAELETGLALSQPPPASPVPAVESGARVAAVSSLPKDILLLLASSEEGPADETD